MQIRDEVADARMARSRGIADYWPWLLRYPLTGYCLPVVLMLALFATLGTGMGEIPTTGIPLLCISALLAVFYLLRVIDHTTRGYATPPPMGSEALYLLGTARSLALPAMSAFSYFACRPAHPGLAQALLGFSIFITPAYLFILATEERLSSALNPLHWLKLIAVMRLAYLLPCLLLVAGSLLVSRVSALTGLAGLVALCCYLLFMTAHVMGYLGYKRHHALGLQVDVPDPDQLARERLHIAQLKALLQQVQELLLARDEVGAIEAMARHAGGPLDAIRFHEELFRELGSRGTPLLLHAAGRRLIALLLAAGYDTRALDIAEGCLNRNRWFMPATPAQLESLLRQALKQGLVELYERLLKGAEADAHTHEPGWAGVQFLRAQYAAETLHDDALALQLLQPLRQLTTHPQHARHERFARTLEALLARKAQA